MDRNGLCLAECVSKYTSRCSFAAEACPSSFFLSGFSSLTALWWMGMGKRNTEISVLRTKCGSVELGLTDTFIYYGIQIDRISETKIIACTPVSKPRLRVYQNKK